MGEAPDVKRARVLSAGPRRKRPTLEAMAQQRAYKKPERKARLTEEAKTIQAKCREIKRLEENIRLVEVLKADRNRPLFDAELAVRRLETDLANAKDHLVKIQEKGTVDVSDLDERQENLIKIIVRLKGDIEHLMKNAIDASSETG